MAQVEDDAETKLRKRLVIVRDAKLGFGTTGALHAYIQQYMGDTFD